MERVYLNLFRYNVSLVGKAREAYFMHALPIETLQLELAQELVEKDLLTMFDTLSQFQRIVIWQALLMLLSFWMQANRITLGTSLDQEPYGDRCNAVWNDPS